MRDLEGLKLLDTTEEKRAFFDAYWSGSLVDIGDHLEQALAPEDVDIAMRSLNQTMGELGLIGLSRCYSREEILANVDNFLKQELKME